MASKSGKRKLAATTSKKDAEPDEVNLFVDAPPDGSDDGSDDDSGDETDTSQSEESNFSGLEDEEDDEEEEESSEVESIEEGESSEEDEDDESDADNQDADASSEDEDADNDNIVEEKVTNGKLLKEKAETANKQNNNKSKKMDKMNKNELSLQKAQPTTQKIEARRKQKPKKTAKPAPEETTSGPTITPGTSTGVPDEYEFDSSDEEDIRNTVGNIPMEWYREFEHIGYDVQGKKIIKPKGGDQIDEFINKMENPDYWRTVTDKTTGQKVVLSDQDVELIQRLRRGRYVDANYNPYEPWVDFFTHEVMKHPVTNRPEHKRSFIPSKWERQKVGRLVHAMKMGWIKPKKEKTEEEEAQERFYMMWKTDDQAEISKRIQHHIPAPKMVLPGHAESYNPPPEYLLNEEEELAWKEQDPEERRMNFVPQKYSSLRHVPAYSRFINERFERCLDLYLCPRVRKTRMNVDPQDLIPKLPKPKDLQPFPTTQAIVYRGHTDIVRTVSADPTGQWIASGSDDETVKFWEVSTGRCMKTLKSGGVVKKVVWNPNTAFCLVAIVVGDAVWMVNPQLGDKLIQSNTDSIINSWEPPEQENAAQKKLNIEWSEFEGLDFDNGCRLKITHPKSVSQVAWHGRGDYFSVVIPDGESQSVIIHQLSKRRSQNPFRKPKGLVQCVLFHPTRPFLFIATQRYVRVYNLLKQELVKKLLTNCKWVSSMAVHPSGDNVIVGSYDCRLSWFDLDLSTKPYQTLRHHKKAVRAASFHARYPLFASASDDGTIIVCHGMVYKFEAENATYSSVQIESYERASRDDHDYSFNHYLDADSGSIDSSYDDRVLEDNNYVQNEHPNRNDIASDSHAHFEQLKSRKNAASYDDDGDHNPCDSLPSRKFDVVCNKCLQLKRFLVIMQTECMCGTLKKHRKDKS